MWEEKHAWEANFGLIFVQAHRDKRSGNDSIVINWILTGNDWFMVSVTDFGLYNNPIIASRSKTSM